MPASWIAWAQAEHKLSADAAQLEADKFNDFWIAKSGPQCQQAGLAGHVAQLGAQRDEHLRSDSSASVNKQEALEARNNARPLSNT
jgi:hypothetical protein